MNSIVSNHNHHALKYILALLALSCFMIFTYQNHRLTRTLYLILSCINSAWIWLEKTQPSYGSPVKAMLMNLEEAFDASGIYSIFHWFICFFTHLDVCVTLSPHFWSSGMCRPLTLSLELIRGVCSHTSINCFYPHSSVLMKYSAFLSVNTSKLFIVLSKAKLSICALDL